MGLAAPAIAAGDQSIEQQYRAAAEIFTAGIGGAERYLKEYAARILEGLDGTWASSTAGAVPEQDSAAFFREQCQRHPVQIGIKSRFAFTLTRSADTDHALEVIYTQKEGNWFTVYMDPLDFIDWLGLDEGQEDPFVERVLRVQNNGMATVHRPSRDILVLQNNNSYPLIYARCHETG